MATLPRYAHRDSKADNHSNWQSKPEFKMLAATSATVGLFYMFCVFALMWIGFVLAFYLIGCMAAFYVIAGILPAMRGMEGLARVIVNSLRLRTGPEWHVRLGRDDAPELYTMVEQVASKIDVEPPAVIHLEMSTGASVRLLGYRAGCGKSELYLGYDLLAVFTRSEMEAIIAHELAHAKLTLRAHSAWSAKGVARACQLTEKLGALVAEHEQNKKKFHTAAVLRRCSVRLTDLVCRIFAEFRRQEEIAADRLAATCCGSEVFASALVRLDVVDHKRGAIDWRDRKISAARNESFSEWLRDKLTPKDEEERRHIEERIMQTSNSDNYSTHPALKDRLAALPLCVNGFASHEPVIQLLSNPDDVAASFIEYIEKTLSEEERKETSAMRRMARGKAKGAGRSRKDTAGQNVGVVAIFLSVIPLTGAIAILCTDYQIAPAYAVPSAALLFGGIALCVKCGRREVSPLPTPTYGAWREALFSGLREAPIADWKDEIERQLLCTLPKKTRGKGATAAFWAGVCYEMLERCDFQRALAASDLCLAADRHRLEGLLTRAISLAYFMKESDSNDALNKAYATNRFCKSMSWGLGWAFALSGNWYDAELYLLKAAEDYPDDATVHAVLSRCQRQRGKLHEGINSARKAVELSGDVDVRLALVSAFLMSGQPKEALEQAKAMENMAGGNFDVMLLTMHAYGLCGKVDQSLELAGKLEELFPGGKTLLNLAHALQDAGQDEMSLRYFERALETGFYPEALYALARAEYGKRNYHKARELWTSALDCTKEPGDGSSGPLILLYNICSAMVAMSDEVEECEAYQVNIDLTDSPAKARSISLLINARSIEYAKGYANWLYGAMHPGKELPETIADWKDTDKVLRPKGPVAPGIHGVGFN